MNLAVTGQEAWEWFRGAPLKILITLVAAVIVRALLVRAIGGFVERAASGRLTGERHRQRMLTLGSLLRSIVTFTVSAIAILTIMAIIGIPLGPLLASAGVGGVALGFGAQSLVKDFLSGVFMILEDQYGVGDVIDLGEASGTVESVGLRVTRLRDVSGTVWYVRNGEVLRVGNLSQNWARSVLDITVGYESDLDQVQAILKQVAHEVYEDETFRGDILEEPEVPGIERFDKDGPVLRVLVKTAPLKQWDVSRALRERIKARFDAAGIRIPATVTAPMASEGQQ